MPLDSTLESRSAHRHRCILRSNSILRSCIRILSSICFISYVSNCCSISILSCIIILTILSISCTYYGSSRSCTNCVST